MEELAQRFFSGIIQNCLDYKMTENGKNVCHSLQINHISWMDWDVPVAAVSICLAFDKNWWQNMFQRVQFELKGVEHFAEKRDKSVTWYTQMSLNTKYLQGINAQ